MHVTKQPTANMEFDYGVIAEKQIPNGIRTGFQLYLPQNRPERVRMVTERSPMSHAGTDKPVQTNANRCKQQQIPALTCSRRSRDSPHWAQSGKFALVAAAVCTDVVIEHQSADC